ncbi:MAG: hypothetical protein LUC83_00845 [Clostridiales bacterium]|nr:hypothetical protein [Clostridiales bacterium]
MNDERTTDLLNELNSMDDKPESFQAFMERHASAQTFHTLADYLNYYISRNPDLHIADVIKRSSEIICHPAGRKFSLAHPR